MINKNNIHPVYPCRILLVEDHALVRAAVRAILKQHPEFLIVHEAGTGKDGIDSARIFKPDVVLLDIELPDISGMQVAKKIMQIIPTKIIALTSRTDQLYLKQLSKLGVKSYLTKNCAPAELVEAIRSVRINQPYMGLRVAEEISTHFLEKPKESPFVALSQRELEILIMICHGEKTALIAEKLFLSPKTINKHRQAFLKKLGVKNDIELAKLALKYGLIKA